MGMVNARMNRLATPYLRRRGVASTVALSGQKFASGVDRCAGMCSRGSRCGNVVAARDLLACILAEFDVIAGGRLWAGGLHRIDQRHQLDKGALEAADVG